MFTGTNGFACRQLGLYITFILPNNLLCFVLQLPSNLSPIYQENTDGFSSLVFDILGFYQSERTNVPK